MKRLAATLILAAVCYYASAGGYRGGRYSTTIAEKKFTFSFNFGVALPTGDFARKDSVPGTDTTHAHGYAKTGFQFTIGISYRFAKNIGVAASLGGSLCAFDVAAYTSSNKVPSDETVTVSGIHYIAQYLIGPYFFFPVSDNFALEGKLLAGIVSAQYPNYTIASNLPNNLTAQTVEFAHASGFGYGASFGGRVKLGEYVGVSLTLSYTGATIEYPGLINTLSTPLGYGYTELSPSTRNMSLGIVGISAGLTISF